jgi:hypothetical protein
MKLLLDDGNQHVGRYGAPDLRLDGVLAGAQKAPDAQVLLDPLEKQFHLQAVLVQRSDGQGRKRRVVRQKNQRLARLRILEADAAQILGVVFGDVKAVHAKAPDHVQHHVFSCNARGQHVVPLTGNGSFAEQVYLPLQPHPDNPSCTLNPNGVTPD